MYGKSLYLQLCTRECAGYYRSNPTFASSIDTIRYYLLSTGYQRVASLPHQAHTLGVCACPTLSPSGSGGRPRPLGMCVCVCARLLAQCRGARARGGAKWLCPLSRAPDICAVFLPLVPSPLDHHLRESDAPFLSTTSSGTSGNAGKTAYSEVPRRRRPSAAAKCTPTTICSLYHYQTQLRLCAGSASSRYLCGDVAASS